MEKEKGVGPVTVTHFEKKCAHGVPMRHIKKMCGASWYEPGDCRVCQVELQKKEEEQEAKFDAFIDRVAKRRP